MENCDLSCRSCSKMQFSLLSFCNHQEILNVDLTKECVFVQKGDVIFEEGDTPEYLFCLKNGQVKLSKKAPNNRNFIIRWAQPGDFIGYRAVLMKKPYTVTATATEDLGVCRIPVPVIWGIFNENTRFRDEAINMLYKSLQETENKLTELAYKPVLGRIAEALLSFKNYQSEEDKELVPVFEINRKDLASMTGTVKETVIRSIKSLKREGVLATNGSKIIILNEDKLAEISKLYD
jgi:CRP/FNR family transcriptional regulator, polysaccharide utilization system transcription regulator